MTRRFSVLLALLSGPAFADIPTIDRTELAPFEDRAQATLDIHATDRSRQMKGEAITCSIYRPAPKNDPVSAAQANSTIANLVRRVAREERVDENEFLALVYQESRFNPCAKSSAGAIGLAQLMPETARDLGVNPYDVEQNLRGGARFYRQQLEYFGGNVSLALAAYNSGPGNVQKYGGIPPFRETQGYVAAITNKWLPALGASQGSGMPGGYGSRTTAFEAARTSTLNAMGMTTSIAEGSGDVASWLAQLGSMSPATIQDSWDHNSGVRNANIELLEQLLQLGSAFAELANTGNAMTLSDMSGTSRSSHYETTGSADGRQPLEPCAPQRAVASDERYQACIQKIDLQAGLQLIPD